MKIIVKAPNWIGDLVMMTPALSHLKKIYPDSKITVLLKPGQKPVLKSNPSVDEIWIANERESTSNFLSTAKKIRSGKFAFGILFPNSFSSALLFFLGRVRRRVGYSRDGRGFLLTDKIILTADRKKMHQVEYYLEILKPLGDVPDAEKKLIYIVTEEDKKRLEEYLKKKNVAEDSLIVAINPGGYFGPSKRWSTKHYAQAAEFLVKKYRAKVFITGSPKEKELYQEIQKNTTVPLIDATLDMDLRLLGAFLQKCKLIITNDSGAMHIAAALDTNIIALFGPTDPNATAPRSLNANVIYRKPDCSPCFLKVCPTDHKCMNWILIDDVTKIITNLLEEKKPEMKTK